MNAAIIFSLFFWFPVAALALQEFPKSSFLLGAWPLNGNPNDLGPRKIHGSVISGQFSAGPFGEVNTALQSTTSTGRAVFTATNSNLKTTDSFTVMLYFAKSSHNREGGMFEFQDSFNTNKAFQFRYKDNTYIEVAGNGAIVGNYKLVRQHGAWTFLAFVYDDETSSLSVYSRHGLVVPASFQPHVRASTVFNNNGFNLGSAKRWGQYLNNGDSVACLMIYSTALTFPEILQAHDACRLSIGLPCGTLKQNIGYTPSLTCGASVTPRPGQFPWIAALRYKGGHICSATIIDQFWLLTVSKCFEKSQNIADYKIVAAEDAVTHDVSSIIIQPKDADSLDGLQFALVALDLPLDFKNPNIADACFLATYFDRINEYDLIDPQIIHGWGINGRTSLTSPSLPRMAFGALLPDEECLHVWGSSEYLGNGVNYCFSGSFTWPCDGDEGAPAMLQTLRNVTGSSGRTNEMKIFVSAGVYYKREAGKCTPEKHPLFAGLGRKQYQWVAETIAGIVPGTS